MARRAAERTSGSSADNATVVSMNRRKSSVCAKAQVRVFVYYTTKPFSPPEVRHSTITVVEWCEMTAMPNSPTSAELALLRVLWKTGPTTVRELHEAVYSGTEIGYTTTLKLLQKMHIKGLVNREESGKQHIYTANVSQRSTLKGVVRQLIDGPFAGSAAELAMHALDAKPIDQQDLRALKDLIAKLERKGAKR